MIRHASLRASLFLMAVLASCEQSPDEELTALLGGVLIDGTGKPPLGDSVLLVLGSKCARIGTRPETPVGARAKKVDTRQKWVVPALIDLKDHLTIPEVSTQEEMRKLSGAGAAALRGIALDTEEFEPALLERMRTGPVVVAPGLARLESSGQVYERARRNTKRLADAGVPIGVWSAGDTLREMELLAAAGLTPAQVMVAATRNGAMAANQAARRGTLEQGKYAALMILAADPLDAVSNLRRVERSMIDGRWQENR